MSVPEQYKDGIRQKLDPDEQGMIGMVEMQQFLKDFNATISDAQFFSLVKASGAGLVKYSAVGF